MNKSKKKVSKSKLQGRKELLRLGSKPGTILVVAEKSPFRLRRIISKIVQRELAKARTDK